MNNHIQLFSIESFYKKKDELNKQLDGKLITIDQYISKLNKLEKKLPKNKQQLPNESERIPEIRHKTSWHQQPNG